MNKFDYKETYNRWFTQWRTTHRSGDDAMKAAIGGEFEGFGILEREVLIQAGLRQDGYVIDIGCGSGRLAKPLSDYLTGSYLGTDVVPDLVEYARKLVARPAWRFEVVDGLTIPEADGQADIVCFFSVLTHLLHEESYVYLREAKRVLKPTGKIIFSFLEFSIPVHWAVFANNIETISSDHPLNIFLSRDAIETWADHLGLRIEAIYDGDKPHIHLPHPIVTDSGAVMQDMGALGQSVCILAPMPT